MPVGGYGSLANGAETAVTTVVQVLAANSARVWCIIQNTHATASVRIGIGGVTATTGLRLSAGQSVTFVSPACPTAAIFAVQDSGASTVLAQEMTA